MSAKGLTEKRVTTAMSAAVAVVVTAALAAAPAPARAACHAKRTLTKKEPADGKELLIQAFGALRDLLVCKHGAHDVKLDPRSLQTSADLTAFTMLSGEKGPLSMEVQKAWPKHVWIAVPHPDSRVQAFTWHAYERAEGGKFTEVKHPRLLSTPYTGLNRPSNHLGRTTDWAFGDDWDWADTNDPPHWSPILVRGDGKRQVGSLEFVRKLHEAMWRDPPAGKKLLDEQRPAAPDVLADRNLRRWLPVTARGRARATRMSEGDWCGHHADDYYDPKKIKTGDAVPLGFHVPNMPDDWRFAIGECTPPWRGSDWQMFVDPDDDTSYLMTATSSEVPDLEVEIENFAVPFEYTPKENDWVQITGRWVIDTGHRDVGEEFHTEIHPPELVVSSRTAAGTTTARVVATGAWYGAPLEFAVFPPPRPTATARIQCEEGKLDGRPGTDRSDRAHVLQTAWPTGSGAPNHMVGTMVEEGTHVPVVLVDAGPVGMTRDRGYRGVFRCTWNLPKADLTVSLRADGGKGPAAGASLFWYDTDDSRQIWQRSFPDASGRVVLAGLDTRKYVLRPAGSGWNFGDAPGFAVLMAGANSITFGAGPYHPPKTTFDGGSPAGQARPTEGAAAAAPLAGSASSDLLAAIAARTPGPYDTRNFRVALSETLLLGVKGAGAPYHDQIDVVAKLYAVTDPHGHPIDDPAAASKPLGAEKVDVAVGVNGASGGATLAGLALRGVPGATVRARFLAGDQATGHRLASEAVARTDASGVAQFRLRAGSHYEEGSVVIDVLANPVNAWFRPTSTTAVLFQPARTGADRDGGTPYTLTVRPASAAVARAALAASQDDERVAMDAKLAKLLASEKLPRSARQHRTAAVAAEGP